MEGLVKRICFAARNNEEHSSNHLPISSGRLLLFDLQRFGSTSAITTIRREYTLALPDNSTIKVIVDDSGEIVTDDDGDPVDKTDGYYSINGYKLTLTFNEDNTLTNAIVIQERSSTDIKTQTIYSINIGNDDSTAQTVMVDDGNISQSNVTIAGEKVRLTYTEEGGLTGTYNQTTTTNCTAFNTYTIKDSDDTLIATVIVDNSNSIIVKDSKDNIVNPSDGKYVVTVGDTNYDLTITAADGSLTNATYKPSDKVWDSTELGDVNTGQTFSKYGVILTALNGSFNSEGNYFSGGKGSNDQFQFTNTLGRNFTRIEITCDDIGFSWGGTTGTWTGEDKLAIWTGNTDTVKCGKSITGVTKFVFTLDYADVLVEEPEPIETEYIITLNNTSIDIEFNDDDTLKTTTCTDDSGKTYTLTGNKTSITATNTIPATVSITSSSQTITLGTGDNTINLNLTLNGDNISSATYKIGNDGTEQTATVTNNGKTVKISDVEVDLTIDDNGKVTETVYPDFTVVAPSSVEITPNVDLSARSSDYTANDGDIITGNLSGCNVTIAAGATVTLKGVNITNGNIICSGDANIILSGENSVTAPDNYAAIQAGSASSTLTIKGTGTLTAKGGAYGAGIGSAYSGSCGNITISGGTITAKGGDEAAGIGGGYGSHSSCGNITITDGVSKVTATKGKEATNSIGAGNKGTCGTVTINGTEYTDGYNGGEITGNGGITLNNQTLIISDPATVYTFTIDSVDMTATFNADGSVKTITGSNVTLSNDVVLIGTKGYKLSYTSGNVNYDEAPTWTIDGSTITYRNSSGTVDYQFVLTGMTATAGANKYIVPTLSVTSGASVVSVEVKNHTNDSTATVEYETVVNDEAATAAISNTGLSVTWPTSSYTADSNTDDGILKYTKNSTPSTPSTPSTHSTPSTPSTPTAPAEDTTSADTTPSGEDEPSVTIPAENTTPPDTVPTDTVPAEDNTPPVTIPADDTVQPVTIPADDTVPTDTVPAEDTVPPVTIPVDETTPAEDTTPPDTTPPDTVPAEDTVQPVTIPADDTVPPVTVPAEVTIPAGDADESIRNAVGDIADSLTSGTSDFDSVMTEVVTFADGNSSVVAEDGNLKTTLPETNSGTLSADYSTSTGKKDVTTSEGDQVITFNDEGGNVARISTDTSGTKIVNTGGGGDVVINANKSAAVTIESSGADTIIASGGDAEQINLSTGAAVIVAAEGANVNNYDVNTGAGFILTGVDNLSEALRTEAVKLTDNRSLNYNNNANLSVAKSTNDTTTGTFVNVYTSAGSKNNTLVGWANDSGQLDATSIERAALLIGNSYNDSTRQSTIVASAQDNTIFAGAKDVVSLNGGADLIVANGGTRVENYDANTGAGLLFAGLDSLIAAIESQDLILDDNEISYKDTGAVSLSSSDDSDTTATTANIYSSAKKRTRTVWTHKSGGDIDLSEAEEAQVVVGNYLNDKRNTSTITGSNQDDTILSGSGDVVNISGGNDVILLKSSASIGAALNLTGESEGNASVSGFNGSFADNADKILLDNLIDMSYTFLSGAFQMTYGEKVLRFDDIATTTSSNYIEKFDTEGSAYKFSFETSDGTVNKAFISNGGTVSITNEEISKQIEFDAAGTGAVDFGGVTDDVCVDVDDTFKNDHYDFNGIKSVIGGAGNSTLIGSNDSVHSYAFYGGSGDSTIISGRGDDTMNGYTGTDKKGSTTFTYFDCQGNDLIKDFNFGTSNISDRLWASLGIQRVKVLGDSVKVYSNGIYKNRSTDCLTIEGAKNKMMKVTDDDRDIVLELGNDLKYNFAVDIYGDIDHADNKITIDSDVTAAVNLVLADHETDKYWNVTKVDASDFDGNATIIGAIRHFEDGKLVEGADCELRGGKGENTIWGGIGNDTLVGGSGYNTYLYCATGDGDDVITNVHKDDIIKIVGNLEDVDLNSLNNVTTTGFTLKMTSGETLKVSGTDLDKMTLKIGSTRWKFNNDGTAFIRKD